MKLFGASLVTLSLLFSFVFFIIILILLVTNSVSIWVAISLTIVVNFFFWLVGPKLTDWINRVFYKVEFLTPQEVEQRYPYLAQLIKDVAAKHRFDFPKVGVIPDNNPTAFTYGSARFNARLIVTQGIFKYLNENEQRAVVGHELGHIVNRDFIVMTIASTLVQILYEIYAVLIRTRGRKNPLPVIGLASYVLYWIGTYLLLFLSRTREKLADQHGAEVVSAEDLAMALIKVAYGIVAESDEGSTARLLASTRHMGLVDVKDSKHAAGVSYIAANGDANVLAEAMVFDVYNPWAKVIELNSTHPLTGRRIQYLSRWSAASGRPFSFNVAGAAKRMQLQHGRLWGGFCKDIGVVLLPFALFGVLLLTGSVVMALLGMAAGFIYKAFYRFPRTTPVETTVLAEMRNPYASPIRGKTVNVQGQVVGRGIPGYVFSEDMMYQDKTGLIFINYHSAFGFIGNLFFAIKRLKTLLGVPSTASGWFTRGMSSSLALRELRAGEQVVKSYQQLWALLWPVLLIGILMLIALSSSSGAM